MIRVLEKHRQLMRQLLDESDLTVEHCFYFLDVVIPLQIFENGFME